MRIGIFARYVRASRSAPFFGVRGKLVIWNIAVLGAILLLVGVGVYVSQSLALDAQVNGQLTSQAQRELAGGLPLAALQEKPATGTGAAGSGSGSGLDTDADGYRADASPNLFSLVLDRRGTVVSGSAGMLALGLPDQAAARAVLAGTAPSTLVTLDLPGGADDGHFRLYTVPVTANGHIVGALQVGTSLAPRYAELRQFLLLLTLCGVGGLVLAAAGGFLLAHRALVPVRVAFERQRAFVADASHELRTPLSLIRAEAELLLRSLDQPTAAPARDPVAVPVAARRAGASAEESQRQAVESGASGEATTADWAADGEGPLSQREMVRDLLAETDYMNRLITALLQLARIDRGQEALTRELVDMDALAARTCQFAQPLAAERGLALAYRAGADAVGGHSVDGATTAAADVGVHGGAGGAADDGADGAAGGAEATSMPAMPEAGGCRVLGDADRLRQLLLILVDNALRYTPAPGSVTVTCCHVADEEEPARVVVRVSDTGPGIAPQHVPHLFDRFYRVDKARSRELGGNGLGLAIGAWIAQEHGGTLAVASTPGAGATFELSLPAA